MGIDAAYDNIADMNSELNIVICRQGDPSRIIESAAKVVEAKPDIFTRNDREATLVRATTCPGCSFPCNSEPVEIVGAQSSENIGLDGKYQFDNKWIVLRCSASPE
ncbi:MAG: hypothetical protein US68_C0031G0006 [Candidatus Shapirobacteria bacterium GW2011_GWE1_38_10]|uniref:Uncharacterized protein n=3 Tax=Microgenomates group TaxID=1794810 RepID=A0A0G0KTN0_9BACT|nr:MAG: hypothetical protein US67_C0072G0004 [Candidatus Woesebacteria bacterium GW2011_GWD1_38_10]KKQ48491.1 MAG: hypothetical protein US68_C0031G0006 [Candidatus Shapirobacteria bacterium GW2011_GWE1_38_10]KKQ83043.1 MAG: hypothetical protein UT06_C0029G0006 [Candidatus Woesebacteria bacterium GW2011_GWA1_38_8]